MTESGNDKNQETVDMSRFNDLGGHKHSEEEMMLIAFISSVMRSRDLDLQRVISWDHIRDGTAPRPKEFISLYTKAAGFVLELAKNLQAYPLPAGMIPKSLVEWIDIVLGTNFGGNRRQVVLEKVEVPEDFIIMDAEEPILLPESGEKKDDETLV